MWRESTAPEGFPWPHSTLKTPGGKPASTINSATRAAARGAFSLDLSTTVLPAIRAGAVLLAKKSRGTFQGMMAATTPKGWRSVRVTKPGVLTEAWPWMCAQLSA